MPRSFKNHSQRQQHGGTFSPPIDGGVWIALIGKEKKSDVASGNEQIEGKKNREQPHQFVTQHGKGDKRLQDDRRQPQDRRHRGRKFHGLHWQPTRKPGSPQALLSGLGNSPRRITFRLQGDNGQASTWVAERRPRRVTKSTWRRVAAELRASGERYFSREPPV